MFAGMTLYAVDFTEEAWAAVEAQIRYIAIEKQSPENAGRWAARLLAAIDTLEHLPKRFGLDEHQTRAVGADVYRLIFERTYLLFYTVDDDRHRVIVVSFRHGARQDSKR